jgi:hypothetical protein
MLDFQFPTLRGGEEDGASLSSGSGGGDVARRRTLKGRYRYDRGSIQRHLIPFRLHKMLGCYLTECERAVNLPL